MKTPTGEFIIIEDTGAHKALKGRQTTRKEREAAEEARKEMSPYQQLQAMKKVRMLPSLRHRLLWTHTEKSYSQRLWRLCTY